MRLKNVFISELKASIQPSRKWAIFFPELVSLDSRNCMDESVVKALYALEDIGMKQYLSRVYSRTAPVPSTTQSNRIL